MMRTFKAITVAGVGNPAAMAGGISEALITTAAGLLVAIPALVAYRYLRGRVDALVIQMEKESIKLVQAIDRTASVPSVAAEGAAA
jgi:biopolymer transport protein ExbB